MIDSILDTNWYLSYKEIKDDLQTGDILLVHGRYPFSIVIEAIQWSPFSHVAMIVRANDVGLAGKAPELLLWESNSLVNLPDFITNTKKEGPMLVDLEERLKTTAIAFSDVKYAFKPLYAENKANYGSLLQQIFPSVIQAGFPTDEEMGLRFFEGRYLGIPANKDLFFCSELVAYTLMQLQLLGTGYPMNAYAPKDFSDAGTVRLRSRAYYGNEHFFNAPQ